MNWAPLTGLILNTIGFPKMGADGSRVSTFVFNFAFVPAGH